ncbi:hypothetical protein HDU76_008122 [Blyttiomyces sp. JEL0837]|nr:hypothetical protein HDU76_008122 [Blyttiomyces sp. JEL0837]
MSSTAIFSQPSQQDGQSRDRVCLLYLDPVNGSASLGACFWPAIFSSICVVSAITLAAYDVWAMQRLYPPRARSNVFYQSIGAAVCCILMLSIGIQIWVGLSKTCDLTSKQHGTDCSFYLGALNSSWELVASGAAFAFASAGLWGFYAYNEYNNFRMS